MEKQTTIAVLERAAAIQKLMWKEIAERGVSAVYTFSAAAILIIVYHWGIDFYVGLQRSLAVFIIAVNLMRLLITKKIIKEEDSAIRYKNFLRSCIWANTLGWSLIFTIGVMGLEHSSYHLAILVTFIAAFVAASMVTLGYDKSIFIPFQLLIMGPIAIYSFYQWQSGKNSDGIYFFICFILFFLYQIKQFTTYRQTIIERMNYQLDLEKSVEDVKAAQAALVNQTAALLHASKISGLGEMAAGLSHEINNSLQVILGSSQQIQRELTKQEFRNPSVEKKLDQSIVSIMKIKSVVDALKYFSQEMSSGPKKDVTLKEIIDQTMSFSQELLKAHLVYLKLSPIPDVTVHCHPFQIAQILFNLIKNADDAIKHINEEKWIDIRFNETEDAIHILVVNSGPPIPPDIQTKLFQPFFSTKDVNAGSGLSLSVSRGIALDHRGDLFFRPQDKHTTFELKLPKVITQV